MLSPSEGVMYDGWVDGWMDGWADGCIRIKLALAPVMPSLMDRETHEITSAALLELAICDAGVRLGSNDKHPRNHPGHRSPGWAHQRAR